MPSSTAARCSPNSGSSLRIALTRGFDVIHACNPPDTIFLIGRFFKLFGKRFIFDHHDINPELYEAKFGAATSCTGCFCRLERWTFAAADVSIATNESYRRIALERGGMTAGPGFRGAQWRRSLARQATARPTRLCDAAAATWSVTSASSASRRLDLLLESVALRFVARCSATTSIS